MRPPDSSRKEAASKPGSKRRARRIFASGGTLNSARSERVNRTSSRSASKRASIPAAARRLGEGAAGRGLRVGPRHQHRRFVSGTSAGQLLVNLLGNEGEEGVQQRERLLEDVDEDGHGPVLLGRVVGTEGELGGLEVPVAQVVPEILVGRGGRVVVAVGGEGLADRRGGGAEPAVDPAVDVAQLGRLPELPALEIHEEVAARVPDLVGELGAELEVVLVDEDVLRGSEEEGERELEGVGAVVVDDLERVDAVAQALGHLAALLVAHEVVM